MSHGEEWVKHGEVELCIERFGDPVAPAVLLIHGACASMLYWEVGFCEALARRGCHVIRYDQRDTGRSTSYPPGEPGYSLRGLVRDAIAILDARSIDRAVVVGQSMSGGIALTLAVEHRERVRALAMIATTSGDDDLPLPTVDFQALTGDLPDVDDLSAIETHLMAQMRALTGDAEAFDEARMRALVRADIRRTRNLASALRNHFAMEFDAPAPGSLEQVAVPTVIVHGTRDPVFPLAHGQRLAQRIRGAELLLLEGSGHEIPPRHWDRVADRLARLATTST